VAVNFSRPEISRRAMKISRKLAARIAAMREPAWIQSTALNHFITPSSCVIDLSVDESGARYSNSAGHGTRPLLTAAGRGVRAAPSMWRSRLKAMRSGNRHRAKVSGRITGLSLLVCGSMQAPILAPLPPPLAELLTSSSHARLTVLATGLTEARGLRLQSDGSLRLDAPGDSLEYRINPRDEGGADVLLAAVELQDEGIHADAASATLVHHEWTLGDAMEGHDVELPAESLEAAKAVARIAQTEAALAQDGTLFVAALDAGILYRVTFAAQTSLRAQLGRPRPVQ
jgi:hypothetical protein